MELRDMGAALWRQRLLVAVVVVVTAIGVAVGVWSSTKTYTATATVSAAPAPGAPAPAELDDLRATLAETATTPEVLRQAATRAGVDRSVGELLDEVDARWVEGTQLIEITVADPSARDAAGLANAASFTLQQSDPTGAFEFTDVDPAVEPATYSSPDLPLAIGVGVLLSLVLAVVSALARDRRTYTVKDAQGVEAALRAPVLAHVAPPRSPTLQAMFTGTPAADVFRRLRLSLEASHRAHPPRLVVVTGVTTGDVNAWLGANLAISLASAGRRVLLLDGRLATPADEPLPEEPDTPGLHDVLRGTPWERAVSPGPVDGLSVLPPVRAPASDAGAEPGDLLERRFGALAEALTRAFDVVVVIAPSLEERDDALVMSAGGSLLLGVVEGVISPEALAAYADRFVVAGVRLAGTVLVGHRAEAVAL
ncbi:hypothetical protein [Nocardioides kribbensis]|uniref:hypothetical protein n=1 Tax=Nocardioides kribbensis TaxID=305517 RepID=UPI0032DB61AE